MDGPSFGRVSGADMPSPRKRAIVPGLIAAAALGACGVLQMDPALSRRLCLDADAEPEPRIEACSHVLRSETLSDAKKARAHAFRGNAWAQKGEYVFAIYDYSVALLLEPDFHQMLNNRGRAWAAIAEHDKAIQDYTAALEVRSDDYMALYNRANARVKKGEDEWAVEDYTEVLSVRPDLHQALSNRGLARLRLGAYAAAAADLNAALEAVPNLPQALYALAWLRATAREERYRDGAEAVRLAEKAVSLHDSPRTRATLAAAYAEAGRFVDAAREHEAAIDGLGRGTGSEQREAWQGRLELYERGQPYRE